MQNHVHSCFECSPTLIRLISNNYTNPKYHSHDKCKKYMEVRLDGVNPGYTNGVFEGKDGWVLFAGKETYEIHDCCRKNICLELKRGKVEVTHREGNGI